MNNWMYNEFRQVGVDYSRQDEVDIYDDNHSKFRDVEKEFQEMLEYVGIGDTHSKTLIDFGCGTGATAILASHVFKTVYAIDVSDAMLARAKQKAAEGKNDNVHFIKAGFLGYEHQSDPVDIIVMRHSFHHLPDFWKQIALFNLNTMLKQGGSLYICDIVFSGEPDSALHGIDTWLNKLGKLAGEKIRSEAEQHIRDEYSTIDWILTGMLEKAGFSVIDKRSSDGMIMEMHGRKVRDICLEGMRNRETAGSE